MFCTAPFFYLVQIRLWGVLAGLPKDSYIGRNLDAHSLNNWPADSDPELHPEPAQPPRIALDNRLCLKYALRANFWNCRCGTRLRLMPLEITAWQIRRKDLQLNETRQTNTQTFRNMLILLLVPCVIGPISAVVRAAEPYRGQPYHDSVYKDGAQKIPGRVMCAYYDIGGEGVAYHDSDATNKGSGTLNPADGSYLNEFRIHEGVDTSYTKYHDAIDDNPFELVHPPKDLLYVGWTDPGEWFNLTVNVKEAGRYIVGLLYTSKSGGAIALDLNGNKVDGLIKIESTYNALDPIAWRQWHHWNYAKDIVAVELPEGTNVLTLHIVLEGNMNLAYLDFTKAE